MKSFNLRRFGQLLKHDLFENKRGYFSACAGILVAHLGSQVGCNFAVFIGRKSLVGCEHSVTGSALVTFIFVSGLIFLAGIAYLFDFLKTKEKRISYFMLPASNLEKFVSRLLICTFGVFVANLLLFFLADGLCTLLSSIFGGNMVVQAGRMWNFVAAEAGPAFDDVVAKGYLGELLRIQLYYVLGLLATLVCYLIGSVVFRRHAFIFTSLVLIAIGLVFGWTFRQVLLHDLALSYMDISPWAYNLKGVFNVAFIIGGTWLSYRLFCRIPVVRRRLFK